jgi:hypothetical protein
MYKYLILTSIVIFINTHLLGQINYINYHKKMCEIDEVIMVENFSQAEIMIDSLFNQYPYIFTKDYVIAAQISCVNNNKKKTLSHLEKALMQGYKLNCITYFPVFKNIVNSPAWHKLLSKSDSLRLIYVKTINQELNLEFVKRFRKEQNAKQESNYRNVVYDNFNKIKRLIDSLGFPNERIIGIDDEVLDSQLSKCFIENERVLATLKHYDCAFSELEQQLYSAIEKGFLKPSEMAAIYTFERYKISELYKKSNKTIKKIVNYEFNFPFSIKSTDIEKVNRDRAKFGICKLENKNKRIEIEKKYGLRLNIGD